MRVFLDANVVLDVLAQREPSFSDSVQVLSLVESGAVEGLIATHTVTTLFYLLTRDQRGFSEASVTVLSPAEFLAMQGSRSG